MAVVLEAADGVLVLEVTLGRRALGRLDLLVQPRLQVVLATQLARHVAN